MRVESRVKSYQLKYLGVDETKGVEFLDDGQQNTVGDSNRVNDKEG